MGEALLNKLRGDVKWPELDAISHLKEPERIGAVRRWLLLAAERHDDKGACYLYELFKLGLADADANEEQAKRAIAESAAEIFLKIPEFKKVSEYNRYSGKDEKRDVDTLVDLKKLLLKDAALQWQRTKDNDEAYGLAAFLVKAAQSGNAQQIGWVTEALQAATETIHHKERTIRLMGRMASETRDNGPARKLLIGVMRTLNLNEMVLLTPLLVWLPFDTLERDPYVTNSHFLVNIGSVPMLDAVERDAESYREMLDEIRKLKDVLKPKKGELRSFVPSFPRAGQVELSIGVSYSWADRGQEENVFHDLAHDIRDQVTAWQKDVRKAIIHLIKLRVFWPVQHGEPKLVRMFEIR